jgi:hypothetical protein
MPLMLKVLIASRGESTIGSPRKLKDVFMSIGTPLRRSKALSNAWKVGFEADVTIWTRADPSACVIAGTTDFFPARTGCTASM